MVVTEVMVVECGVDVSVDADVDDEVETVVESADEPRSLEKSAIISMDE